MTAVIASLEFFRTRFAVHPFLLLVAAVLLLLLVRRTRIGGGEITSWATAASRSIRATALIGLAVYVAVVVWYASVPQYFDNAEPTMTAVGWLFIRGEPVYHPVAAAERYALIYGPVAFMAHGLILGLFGPSIAVSKWLGAAAALASVALLFVALRSVLTASRSIVLTGIYATLLLGFRNYSFWTRPEPLQLFCVAAALVLAVRTQGLVSALFIGSLAGILSNLKITGPLYALPIFVILQHRAGWRSVFVACGAAAAVALLPFTLANISWGNYVEWVSLSARTGLVSSTLRRNLEWAAYFAVPILLSYRATRPEQRRGEGEGRSALMALGLATAAIVVAASKPGAGPYHLLPLLPMVFYVVAYRLRDTSPAAVVDPSVPIVCIAFVLVAGLVGTAQQVQFLVTMSQRTDRDEAADIERFASGHRGVIDIGYGSTDAFTLERPLLVFRNNSYLLDQPAVREHQLAGVELPPATLDALRSCRVNYWLIPKGETPFSARNPYPAVFLQPLFSDEFRRLFHQRYRVTAATAYYDVWECV